MYAIMTSVYPNDKAKEAADTYLKAMAKYPDDASLAAPIVPLAVRATHQGMKVIVIYEVKKGKYEEALALGVKRMGMFQHIPGYRYSIKTYMNIEEAMKTVGT
jgi:hypothetical protein